MQRIFAQHAPDLSKVKRFISRTANLMCGMPDYDTYVAHRKARHPGEPVMSREEFFRNRQSARYADGSGRGMRCC
jgi:uncharacterized short protein YbdD (DUF466 family)